MKDDEGAVSRHLDVQLPGVGMRLPAQARRLDGVLGGPERITPMSDDQGTIASRVQQSEKPVGRWATGVGP